MNIWRAARRKLKQALKHESILCFISWLIERYLTFVYKTTRWQYIGLHHIQPYLESGQPFLGAFWHNRLAMMSHSWPKGFPCTMMISAHGDGQLIAKVIARLGIDTIYGSSSRGAVQVMREAVKKLQTGSTVGITPDGPRGPRYTVQKGAIRIAQLADVKIFTACYATKRRIVFNSWDRFIFPLPFSQGIFIYSKPITVYELDTTGSIDGACHKLQAIMQDIAAQADHYCGHKPMDVGQPKVKRR